MLVAGVQSWHEYAATAEHGAVHKHTTITCYNAAGQPLSTVQKQLISQLSSTVESKSVFVSERGLTSTQWSEYSENTKRIQYSAVPTSDITAETVTVDGNVTLHQRYIYRGFLQIACIDLTRSHHPALWYITWDPTQNTATRPLALQKALVVCSISKIIVPRRICFLRGMASIRLS